MRVRGSVIGLLLVGFLLGAAVPASAVIAVFTLGMQTFNTATDSATATGNIRCTAGETFTVEVSVAQKNPGYRGNGFTTGTCTGSNQNWTVTVSKVSGDLVAGVTTRTIAVAKSFNASLVVTEKERIVRFSTPT
jgi:hypothetical protein